MSGGGGSSPSTSTNTVQTLPSYVQPYVTQMLGNAQSLSSTPYQQYQGQQVAGFSPMQTQAMQNIQQMRPSAQTGQATGMAGLAGLGAGNIGSTFNPQNPTNQYNGGYSSVNTQDYTGGNVDKYMSPYMNDVVEQQKRGAIQDYGRSLPQLGSSAAQAGAYGGTRSDIMQAEGNRNLQTQLQGIQATGSQAAFQNAQQMFQNQQQRELAAQQANQSTRMQDAATRAQFGQSAQALGEQQKEYGSTLGLQGLQTQLQSANTLGNLGQQDFQQRAGINTALLGTGALQQQQQQTGLNTSYQNYINQLNHPYTQLNFMNSLIHGFTPNQQTTTYQAPGSTAGQVAGLGLGLGSLFGALG